ncbi:aminodeoxychorismate/anthranilate synthase component II [Staphylococcus taiwanensis]|nr:aminodeoxychorismate/anthranilate synthase component II [Staphylococcus taiwanensis]
MILIIDNYDSFTYNLVDVISQIDDVIVKYPDEKDVLTYLETIDALIISPGPGHPLDNDYLINIIDTYQTLPILGICLGAQALTCYYGGHVVQGKKVMHGKVDTTVVTRKTQLYKGLPHHFKVMRYHSHISDESTLPNNLLITGRTEDSIQSFEDKCHLHYGIQYHPESFATEYGQQIINNFISIVKERSTLDGTSTTII